MSDKIKPYELLEMEFMMWVKNPEECPHWHILKTFAKIGLSDEQKKQVRKHIAHCIDCAELVFMYKDPLRMKECEEREQRFFVKAVREEELRKAEELITLPKRKPIKKR